MPFCTGTGDAVQVQDNVVKVQGNALHVQVQGNAILYR